MQPIEVLLIEDNPGEVRLVAQLSQNVRGDNTLRPLLRNHGHAWLWMTRDHAIMSLPFGINVK
jgi:hypothetical protein